MTLKGTYTLTETVLYGNVLTICKIKRWFGTVKFKKIHV